MKCKSLSFKKLKQVVICLMVILGYYLLFFYYSAQHHLVITKNLITGTVSRDSANGFHFFSPPWVLVSKIDTRPHTVCIASASRNLNCKSVRILPDKWEALVLREGFHYYWWYNRISFNWDQKTYRGVSNLLLGHAYGTARCDCVEILEEVGDDH